MSPFEPAGDRARWRVLYDLLKDRKAGDLLTYQEMADALDLDPVKHRTIMQLAMRRAAREFETVDKHAVDSITNIGYRIVEPEVHVDLARRHQRKAGKSLVRGHSKVANVDLNDVSPDLRRVIEITAAAFTAQMDFNRRLDVRQKNLEQAVDAVSRRTEEQEKRTAEELTAMQDRLRRLEARLGEQASESE